MSDPRNPRLRHGREPSAAAVASYFAANAKLEAERGLPSGFFASAGRLLRSKAQLRDILRDSGLSKGAAERIAAAGWPALSPESAAAETADAIRAAAQRLRR